MVGVAGFEPTASSSRTKRATKLRHTPVLHLYDSAMLVQLDNDSGVGSSMRNVRFETVSTSS